MYVVFVVCKFEIECMLRYFKELTKNKLDRTGLRDILHNSFRLTDDIIMDRGRPIVKDIILPQKKKCQCDLCCMFVLTSNFPLYYLFHYFI